MKELKVDQLWSHWAVRLLVAGYVAGENLQRPEFRPAWSRRHHSPSCWNVSLRRLCGDGQRGTRRFLSALPAGSGLFWGLTARLCVGERGHRDSERVKTSDSDGRGETITPSLARPFSHIPTSHGNWLLPPTDDWNGGADVVCPSRLLNVFDLKYLPPVSTCQLSVRSLGERLKFKVNVNYDISNISMVFSSFLW